MLSSSWNPLFVFVVALILTAGCSTTPEERKGLPIEDPFGNFYPDVDKSQSNLVLRTKRGNQSLEVELPRETSTNLVMPITPQFRGDEPQGFAGPGGIDSRYDNRRPIMTDREIASSFPQAISGSEAERAAIEEGLGVAPSLEDQPDNDLSYLAKVDRAKQLYRKGRFEAALLEVDNLIRSYPTSPRLYEMKGTLLDRMGFGDLAIQAWRQSLRLNPRNPTLLRHVKRRERTKEIGKGAGG